MARVDVRIESVVTRKQWAEFIALPWAIYQGDPHWVPPLRMAVRDLLDTRKNPFFKHARMVAVVARDSEGKRCLGRVIGVIDENHNRFHDEKTAFFGFYESIDNSAVAAALFGFVGQWAKGQGMERLRGPMNPSTNHECGLLVEGHGEAPSVMMTYNPPYYAKLFAENGFEKSKDLFAYDIDHRTATNLGPMAAQQSRLAEKAGVVVRAARMQDFDSEIDKILEIYNDAWEKNWGFVPMNEE
ncbi:MAG: acyl-CoA N-acyltransferase, partial [Bdellovibrionota bacterium]